MYALLNQFLLKYLLCVPYSAYVEIKEELTLFKEMLRARKRAMYSGPSLIL